jgi:glycosyltransferase 2 family protein
MSRQSLRGLALGLGISLVAILLLALLVDWNGVFHAWQAVSIWVVFPAIGCVLVAMVARTMAWRSLMGNATPVGKSFWDLQISYLLNNLLPFRMGDIARAVLISRGTLNRPARVSAGEALSAVAVERVYDLIYAFAFFIAVLPIMSGAEWAGRSLALMLVAALGGFALLAVLSAARIPIVRWADGWANRLPILRRGIAPLDSFLLGLASARTLSRGVPGFLWLGAGWICWMLEYWVVLESFLPGSGMGMGLLALVGGMAGVSVPAAPGSLGVYEGAVSGFLMLGGLALASATAFAIALHIFNIILLSVLGILGLGVEGVSLGSVWQNAQQTTIPTAETITE